MFIYPMSSNLGLAGGRRTGFCAVMQHATVISDRRHHPTTRAGSGGGRKRLQRGISHQFCTHACNRRPNGNLVKRRGSVGAKRSTPPPALYGLVQPCLAGLSTPAAVSARPCARVFGWHEGVVWRMSALVLPCFASRRPAVSRILKASTCMAFHPLSATKQVSAVRVTSGSLGTSAWILALRFFQTHGYQCWTHSQRELICSHTRILLVAADCPYEAYRYVVKLGFIASRRHKLPNAMVSGIIGDWMQFSF